MEEVLRPCRRGIGAETGIEALGLVVERDHQPGRGHRLAAARDEPGQQCQEPEFSHQVFDSTVRPLLPSAAKLTSLRRGRGYVMRSAFILAFTSLVALS